MDHCVSWLVCLFWVFFSRFNQSIPKYFICSSKRKKIAVNIQLITVPCCKHANAFNFELKLNIGWDGLQAAALLNIISIIVMNRVQFTSIESLLSWPFFPPKEKDYCASDLQQIGRLVAHHSAITQAFIYLHMQARVKNVLNSQEQMQKTGSSHIWQPKMCDLLKIMGGPEKQECSRT